MTRPFHFKQFTIHQDRCAMKVGTDGVLLGAWADVGHATRILDVGTGTGLIALMLAQRTVAPALSATESNAVEINIAESSSIEIDAIEIDRDAYTQAVENVANSPWPTRIRVLHGSVQWLSQQRHACYDMIVANPPYFEKSLHAPDPARTVARHTTDLSLPDLFQAVARLLLPGGRFCMIFPQEGLSSALAVACANGYNCRKLVRVKPVPHKASKRVLVEFQARALETVVSELTAETVVSELTIEVERHRYTDEFYVLTQDFYGSTGSHVVDTPARG